MLKDDVQPYLNDLRLRKTTNREVARILGVSESYLSRVLADINFTRVQSETARKQQEQEQRRQDREQRSKKIKGLSVAEAVQKTGVSERTIYRERAKWKTTD